MFASSTAVVVHRHWRRRDLSQTLERSFSLLLLSVTGSLVLGGSNVEGTLTRWTGPGRLRQAELEGKSCEHPTYCRIFRSGRKRPRPETE